ncbi:MAG TPA: bifunctional uroporphyrinogen-III C-methyltransferase/uroporphyrinogen-III synthase [Intrasporangiaceae bacterium]|nr:bifunctional uroporphyrinogen-III C-methyltransferase/uroporphyrinogen-III synthase [Intrasporangiaceae bacterium]
MSTRSATATATRPAHVAFVGAGPGDPALLTVAATELLARADTIVIDHLAREVLVERFARPDVTIVDAGTDSLSHGDHGRPLTHAAKAKLVVQAAKAAPGGLVVRLLDGDPAMFAGLAEEALACHKAKIGFDIVPGVSAVSAVPTYAGIPLTTSKSRSVHVCHGPESITDAVAADVHSTLVLLGTPDVLGATLARLLDAGRAPDTPVAITENGTIVRQRTIVTTLGECEGAVPQTNFPALAVVSPTVALRQELSWFETKPLFGWDVLVPRTKEQSASVTRRLQAYGANSSVVPTISVEPPRTPHQMDKAIKGMVTGRYEWIGFTSVNAVKAVREKFEENGLDARALSGLKIAAVGGVTADALRAWGLNPDLIPSGEQSARGLLEDWPPYDDVLDPINRVLLPRADIATDTLVAGLLDMGWEVDDVTAYRTVRAAPPAPEIREAIKTGKFDAVLFTSSSTVRNLVGIAGKPHACTVIACIGPATAKTAEEYGLRVDVLAPEANVLMLVDALADHGAGLAAAALEAGEEVQRPSLRRPTARRRAKRNS